jgi:uncharacterized membrane protein
MDIGVIMIWLIALWVIVFVVGISQLQAKISVLDKNIRDLEKKLLK